MPDPRSTDLREAWAATCLSVADLGADADAEQWRAPTSCPGWTVGDLVAHVEHIEQLLAGHPQPQVDLDWDSLPHVIGDVGRFTEAGVAVRRDVPQEQVVVQLRAIIAERQEQIYALPDDAEVPSPMGRMTKLRRLLSLRCFDVWFHEQDLRSALGRDGGWDSPAAWVTFDYASKGLARAWEAASVIPPGSGIVIEVTGPGVTGEITAGEGETVRLRMTWPDAVALIGGRGDVAAVRTRVESSGDAALGAAVLDTMTITP